MKNLLYSYKNYVQNLINYYNRLRLKNKVPTIICSDCTAGMLYHWLNLRFMSPTINLYFEPIEFVVFLQNFDIIINKKIIEFKNHNLNYPVGKFDGFDVKIYFMHYKTFDEAVKKWEIRKKRIDKKNLCVMFTNYRGEGGSETLLKFDKLPFKNKVVFTEKKYPNIKSVYYLKNYKYYDINTVRGVYRTCNIFGFRYIDCFDYVDFFNNL